MRFYYCYISIQRYNFDETKHTAYIDKIITRFENPYLHDDTARVGRQPIRKLSPNDRLIKPLMGTFEYHVPHLNLVIDIAAALNYRNKEDEQVVELESIIQQAGIESKFTALSMHPSR